MSAAVAAIAHHGPATIRDNVELDARLRATAEAGPATLPTLA